MKNTKLDYEMNQQATPEMLAEAENHIRVASHRPLSEEEHEAAMQTMSKAADNETDEVFIVLMTGLQEDVDKYLYLDADNNAQIVDTPQEAQRMNIRKAEEAKRLLSIAAAMGRGMHGLQGNPIGCVIHFVD